MKLYKYTGEIASTEYFGRSSISITLYDPSDYDVPPTRLTVYGELAIYINNVLGHDEEERYLRAEYYYDRLLNLQKIVIPAKGSLRPAKIIVAIDNYGVRIFGNPDRINVSEPEPMSDEHFDEYLEWKWNND